MSTNTYVALATQTLGSAAASVTFSSIPQGYTDLIVTTSWGRTAGNPEMVLQLNGDTATNYSVTTLEGAGTSAVSQRQSSVSQMFVSGFQSGAYSSPYINIINFNNYSNATTYKTVISRNSANSAGSYCGLWRNTAAITSIKLDANGSTFTAGSTFTIYGIAATSVGAKATGGTIYSDSSYYYHVFAANGTFTPTQSISADVLVIAGGGGGGNGASQIGSGGGGAGGLLYSASQSLTATGYTCTIGAGGAVNAKGVNSSFGGITASVAGGRGATSNSATDINGGSGGGGAFSTNTSGGTATSGQGNAGGTGNGAASLALGAGGGGAGAVGGNANTAIDGNAGNGGVGSSTYSSWSAITGVGQNVSGTYYLAGGGGGGVYDATGNNRPAGTGGFGGGGRGGSNIGPVLAVAGTANTGGGGGGRGDADTSAGAAGGSGVIIVRYAK